MIKKIQNTFSNIEILNEVSGFQSVEIFGGKFTVDGIVVEETQGAMGTDYIVSTMEDSFYFSNDLEGAISKVKELIGDNKGGNKMDKRVNNIVARIEKNNGKSITLRRDILVKMAQSQLFNYKDSYNYDEMFGVSEGKNIKGDFTNDCNDCKNSSVGFCRVSLKDNCLVFACHVHSNRFFDLYIDLNNTNENTKKEIENTNVEDTRIVLNEEKNGVEIHFNNKPSEDVRNELKANGFRWSKYNKCWYAKQSEETLLFANSLVTPEIIEDILLNDSLDTEIIEDEEIETIIKHAEEYTNQVLKEELQELEENEIIETNNNIFLNDVSIARKPSSIEDLNDFTELENIVISKYLVLNNNTFNILCNDFFMDFNPIAEQGGTRGFINGLEVDYSNYNSSYDFYNDKSIMKHNDNILITNEDNTKFIVVNPEGHSYCRYVGALTVSQGDNILKQLKGETKINNLNVIETQQNDVKSKDNYDLIIELERDVLALENRLKLVKSAKLKYKIELQINNKMKTIAKIIVEDPILYAQFMNEAKEIQEE